MDNNFLALHNLVNDVDKKRFFSLVVIISLLGLAVVSTRIQKVRAPYPIITIEADGSINPPTNITSLDNITYSFTADINACIIVERSNIFIDGNGYTLNGLYALTPALNLTNVVNVTISGLTIAGFGWGICLECSNQNIISNNNLTQNEGSIQLNSSFGNKIASNTITNTVEAIILRYSNANIFSGNNISDTYGVYLENSEDNTISENIINRSQSTGIILTQSSNNTISLNAVENCHYHGIHLTKSVNNTISDNWLTRNDAGAIRLYSSWDNMISGNEIIANSRGIDLSASSHNTLSGNNITSNINAGISVKSAVVNSFVVGSYNNIISENSIVKNYNGIEAVGANFTNIFGNSIKANSLYGITFDNAGHNTVIMNSIESNGLGIFIEGRESTNNIIYHNNIVDNAIQVELQITYPLDWDNGVEGNYWSDFSGVDSNHDGISDIELAIGLDSVNVDHFPLMGAFHSFNTSVGEFVNVISNSTVIYFHYEESKGWITIQVCNATIEQAFGFLRVSIPHNLIDPDVTWIHVVINDGTVMPLHLNNTLYDNSTHRWIYVAYPHSLIEIMIIPENTIFTFWFLGVLLCTFALKWYLKRFNNLTKNKFFS